MKTQMKKRWLLVILGVAAGVGWLWLTPASEQVQKTAAAELPVVAVAKAERRDLARELTLTGELTPYQEVEVMAKVAGYVQRIYVDVGDFVSQGQVLAVLEVPEMRDDLVRAAAGVQRYRADLARAKDEIKRAETAYEMAHLTATRLASVSNSQPGLVAQQEIDDAKSRDLMAAAQVAAARSALAAAEEQINVAMAEENKLKTVMQYTRVVAPFSGVVTKRYADTGSMIQAGIASQTQAMPVVRLSQNSLLRLVLPVPESAAGLIRPGSGVEVRVPSVNRAFGGRVARIAEQVDTSTRTMRTEVDVPNADRKLISGMYAEIRLSVAESRGVVAVPLQAITLDENRRMVRVVAAAGKIETREIGVGLETARFAEVKSGVKEGELVVVGSRGQLADGQSVKPKVLDDSAGEGGY